MPLLTQDRKDYLAAKHCLHPYHFVAIDALMRETDLRGRCVLEIGGSNMPREMITEDFKVDHWVSVDMTGEERLIAALAAVQRDVTPSPVSTNPLRIAATTFLAR
jgi:hypothetical protein